MMAAVVPSSTPIVTSRQDERHKLLSELLDAVKQCQIRFGGRAELATESDVRVAVLCNRLEAALGHGLRSKPLLKNSSTIRQVTDIVSSSLHLSRGPTQEHLVFWHYAREHLTRHEFERYLVLKQVWTDTGRGRAWLRSALNERSLERYFHCLVGNVDHIGIFYEDWAFLADQERSSMLTTMAAGLGSILFAISIDNLDLNQPRTQRESPEPLVTSLSNSTLAEQDVKSTTQGDIRSKKKVEQKRRKRIPANIISFDDDDISMQTDTASNQMCSSSAPSTCLNSPSLEQLHVNITESPQPHNVTKRPSELQLTPQSTQSTHRPRSAEPNTSMPESPDSLHKGKDARSSRSSCQPAQTLTPVNNMGVGELIPVGAADETHSEEDSLSVPSYSEDTDCAAAALLATQKLLQNNCFDFTPAARGSNVNHSSHVNGEVREALLTLLARKEDLQAETRSLRRLLDQATESSSELRAELDETLRQHKEKTDRLDTRIQALMRENELLKHQLRKYVGAVQMLKRDGTQAHEALASLEAAQQQPVPDYHHEAQEYEKKLIQVAEMHGELMEFNDRLHRLILHKDVSLRRLREELIELRGPLPNDVASSDDEASVVSDGSSIAIARTLINIWIPSAFLTGGSADVHHVYQVFVRIRDDEWNIYRRYSQFHSLHKELKKKDAVVATFDFPPKKTLGNKDAGFVEERRRRLQHYLRCVVNQLGQSHLDLSTAPDKDLLVSMIPFFSEVCNAEDKSRRKRANSRNPFSRLTRNTESSQGSVHSPQYTGL